MNTYYAVTVKNTYSNKKPTIDDYEMWVVNAINKGMEFKQVSYELDKSNRLHLHAVMLGPPKLFRKRLMFNNYHQMIDEILTHGDLIRWVRYIEKCDQHEVEQVAITQEIQTTYPFITA